MKVSEMIAEQLNGTLNQRTWGDVLYNVKVYGARGDGAADDTTEIASAITAAAVAGGVVAFSPGTYITGSITVPSNVTLWFVNGAKLSIKSGSTVTINGPIDAGLHQIFSGSGNVAGAPKVESFYPQWWGAKGDATNDDTTAIESAILLAYASGGATVYLKSGKYKITSLYLHINVRLVGESYLSNNVYAGAVDHRGTWFYCIGTVDPAVKMTSNTKIQNIGFFYPNQVTNAAPTVYPPTIKTETSHVKFTIQEVMLQNSYIGIECNTSHENLTIQDVQGLPIFKGIVVDQGSDLDRISNVNFSWNCWYEAGDTLKRWIVDNGTAFTIRKTDWGFMTGSNCFGYQIGLLVENSPVEGIPSAFNFSRNGFDACVKPIVVSGGYGLRFNNITMAQYNYFDLAAPPDKAILLSDTDSLTMEDILIGPTYGNGININNSKSIKLGNIIIKDFGRPTTGSPAKFGIFLIGGNNRIKIKDCFIDGNNNANTYGVFVTGTNTRLNISDNHISKSVVSSILLDAGSSLVICKNNQFESSGALSDGLGAVTKDISANMG